MTLRVINNAIPPLTDLGLPDDLYQMLAHLPVDGMGLVVGPTGSGKTEALLSLQLNSLCWGRGMTFSDGKEETTLAYSIWSLMRRFGQEDNYYVLNFLNGVRDQFDALLGNDRTRPQSNSINLFGEANTTFIIQLMESLLPQVGANDAGWQDKAKPMLYGLVYALYYK
ncbi:hypothetical protein [Candidatus Sodalis pierantonius]|uniref:hypothetical protein n=1 Tax=Candidatus Sodalis pierantonii TaxID=1486991 RepID=UPI0004B19B78|nr:hypothetical protein [Candidatus Sodalis pierantonius]